jgi:uncharacterized protein
MVGIVVFNAINMTSLKKIFASIFVVICFAMLIVACGGNDPEPDADFDRKAMLQNFAKNLIKPAFKDLQVKTNDLKFNTDAFIASPDAAKLATLQSSWDAAYSSWMYANAYNVGPAGEEGIRKGLVEEIGTWPSNTTVIEHNIKNNKTDLNDFSRDNRGFNAIDYLIFDINNDQAKVVGSFINSANRKNYLVAITNKLKSQVDAVVTEWDGSYAANFINNNGTSVGSSTAQFYNEFVRSFESAKNFKVGLPLGKRVGQTDVEPSRVEARYSGKSIKYLKMNIQAIEDIWYGKSKAGADGVGWKEYLASATGGNELITRTEAQMAIIKTNLNAIADSPTFEQQIKTNQAALSALHTELQKHTRNYKSDMSSILGIAITFSSGDGD